MTGTAVFVSVRKRGGWMSAYRVVNHGVDTVVLNAFYTDEDGHPIKRELEQALQVQLDEWKRASQGIHDEYPTTVVFNGATLHMQPNGAGQVQRYNALHFWWAVERHCLSAVEFGVPVGLFEALAGHRSSPGIAE